MAGVYEKLKRADETIQKLNSEIDFFLKKCPEGRFSDDKQKAAKELIEFHTKRGIPLRFGVLAGEIIHHLRSSLEHVAWMLSSEQHRLDDPTGIAFPIFTEEPKKKELARYCRNIEGIESPDARALIKQLQPYKAPNPTDDPLAILHELDREDKHHTLILIVCAWNLTVSIPLSILTTSTISPFYGQTERHGFPLTVKPQFEFAPYIAFTQIGGWKGESVIPVLTVLLNKVRDVVRKFSELPI